MVQTTLSGTAATRSCRLAEALQSAITMGNRPAKASISNWRALVLPLPVAPHTNAWWRRSSTLTLTGRNGLE
jgi:hypothetical protein